jgi:hypothetical protein
MIELIEVKTYHGGTPSMWRILEQHPTFIALKVSKKNISQEKNVKFLNWFMSWFYLTQSKLGK